MRSLNHLARRSIIGCLLLFLFAASLPAFQNAATDFKLTGDQRSAVDRISAASLREHLKCIASDELEGRNTPSPGLDRAAEYIAAQFKNSGLEPIGDDRYFQTAHWVQMTRNPGTFSLSIQSGAETFDADPAQMRFSFPSAL